MRGERGFVLLLSLWATAALGGLAVVQATRVSLELKWAGRLQEKHQAWHLAWAGIQAAGQTLALDSEKQWDAPKEAWGRPTKKPIPFEGGSFQVSVFDEQAQLDLNAATREQLLRLPGFGPACADQLLANREKNKMVSHLAQLQALSGFDPNRLAELSPLVTVHGKKPVNLNAASKEVLVVLGLSADLSSRVVQFQRGPDGIAGTSDDNVFTDKTKVIPDLEAVFGPLLPEDQTALSGLVGSEQIGVSSSSFRVEVEGISRAHGVSKKVIAVVERGSPGNPPVIKGWRES